MLFDTRVVQNTYNHKTYSFDHEIKPERESLLIAADLLCDLKPLSQQVLDSTIYKVYSQLSESEGEICPQYWAMQSLLGIALYG